MISALGSIGIAAIEHRPAENPQARAYLVILYTDFYALVLSITCFAVRWIEKIFCQVAGTIHADITQQFLIRDACEQRNGAYLQRRVQQ